MNDAPIILAIESSGDSGGAALLRAGEVMGEQEVSRPRGHGGELVPCIEALLDRLSVKRAAIDAVLVNEGPGSYTGLRVGHAAAETIAYALRIPAIGVPGLEVMAEQARRLGWLEGFTGTLLPALDARRGEFVCAPFTCCDDGVYARQGEDRVLPPERLAELAPEGGLVIGDAASTYADAMPEGFSFKQEPLPLRPGSVGLAGLRLAPDLLGSRQALQARGAGQRVELRYFRPILALTVAQRQAQAEAKAKRKG